MISKIDKTLDALTEFVDHIRFLMKVIQKQQVLIKAYECNDVQREISGANGNYINTTPLKAELDKLMELTHESRRNND